MQILFRCSIFRTELVSVVSLLPFSTPPMAPFPFSCYLGRFVLPSFLPQVSPFCGLPLSHPIIYLHSRCDSACKRASVGFFFFFSEFASPCNEKLSRSIHFLIIPQFHFHLQLSIIQLCLYDMFSLSILLLMIT